MDREKKEYMYACKKCGACFYAFPSEHKKQNGLCADCFEGDGEEYAEIVRCKDCKYLIDHYGFMDDGYCENMRETYCLKFKPEDDWFCADGERRTDDV